MASWHVLQGWLLLCLVGFAAHATVLAVHAVQAVPPPCTLLTPDGTVADGAAYTWTLRNLIVDTAPLPANESESLDEADAIGPRNVSFVLATPALDRPLRCRGARYPPEDDVWQACVVDDSSQRNSSAVQASDVWVTFSTDFLINNYVELNQTWICQTKDRRVKMQATGGESLGWFVCDSNASVAVLEAQPGRCRHVQPLLSPSEAEAGAATAGRWTDAEGDVIHAASIVVE